MDIITGLNAASQALGLVKQLKELDKAIDEAAFKAKLIELQEALFEAKSALLDAKETALEKDDKLRSLERRIRDLESGELCPLCRVGHLKVTAVRAHPSLGELGHQEHDLECDNRECLHRERRLHVPQGAIQP